MFNPPVVFSGGNISQKTTRMLQTRFNAAIHLRLMWEADEWVRQCYVTNKDTLNCEGDRGDLYFLVLAYKHELASSVWVWPGRTWNVCP